jgi:hypothetical protein
VQSFRFIASLVKEGEYNERREYGSGHAEGSTVTEGEEMESKMLDLQAVARDLYQTGLDLGLTPAEAALLISEMALPLLVCNEAEEEFAAG